MRILFVRHGESSNNHKALQSASADTELAESWDRLPDPSLTPAGAEAGPLAATWIQQQLSAWGECDVKILCSPMHRALESAWYLQQVTRAPVWVDPTIGEIGGLFQGTRNPNEDLIDRDPANFIPGVSADDVRERFGTEYNVSMLPVSGGWWNRPRESLKDARKRARLLHKRLIACSRMSIPEGSRLKAESGWWSPDVWTTGQEKVPESVLVVVSHGLFFDQVMRCVLGLDDSGVKPAAEILRGDGMDALSACFILDNWASTVLEYRWSPSDDHCAVCVHCHNVSTYLPRTLRREQRVKNKFKSIVT
eukprot:Gregarina_sp_Poly_1__2259@NODE_15_length_23029_cov_81_474305_g13_i0_p9_GENE_NODE_15_length_23029_cov_81_474305_g13_i0NODE_15_length_23029_cov_81_474305_g13_i0_p9_ORF_typecomplete_len307_score38_88His_Phos_1/PF00300_22/1_5e16_NODE_15_length_23029_cov_81_474305_g13_i01028311203